jgi:hypothetical protein
MQYSRDKEVSVSRWLHGFVILLLDCLCVEAQSDRSLVLSTAGVCIVLTIALLTQARTVDSIQHHTLFEAFDAMTIQQQLM